MESSTRTKRSAPLPGAACGVVQPGCPCAASVRLGREQGRTARGQTAADRHRWRQAGADEAWRSFAVFTSRGKQIRCCFQSVAQRNTRRKPFFSRCCESLEALPWLWWIWVGSPCLGGTRSNTTSEMVCVSRGGVVRAPGHSRAVPAPSGAELCSAGAPLPCLLAQVCSW